MQRGAHRVARSLRRPIASARVHLPTRRHVLVRARAPAAARPASSRAPPHATVARVPSSCRRVPPRRNANAKPGARAPSSPRVARRPPVAAEKAPDGSPTTSPTRWTSSSSAPASAACRARRSGQVRRFRRGRQGAHRRRRRGPRFHRGGYEFDSDPSYFLDLHPPGDPPSTASGRCSTPSTIRRRCRVQLHEFYFPRAGSVRR